MIFTVWDIIDMSARVIFLVGFGIALLVLGRDA